MRDPSINASTVAILTDFTACHLLKSEDILVFSAVQLYYLQSYHLQPCDITVNSSLFYVQLLHPVHHGHGYSFCDAVA